jgi:hypothetical protein
VTARVAGSGHLVNVIGALLPVPPGPTADTVATYEPAARLLKNVARSTVMSPFEAGVGLPRLELASGVAVVGFAPDANISSR